MRSCGFVETARMPEVGQKFGALARSRLHAEAAGLGPWEHAAGGGGRRASERVSPLSPRYPISSGPCSNAPMSPLLRRACSRPSPSPTSRSASAPSCAIGVLSPIASGLSLSHSEAGMVMSIYALAYAIGSPLAIAATGALDRRRVILIGLGIFLVASILCALAANAEMLLAARALGALGAGMVTPVGAAIAVAKSPPERRGAALSFVILGLTLAQVAGIPLGSFLGYTAGWRAAFWLVTAMTALALAGVLWRVPKIRTPVTTLGDLGRTLASPVLIVAILITASVMGGGLDSLHLFRAGARRADGIWPQRRDLHPRRLRRRRSHRQHARRMAFRPHRTGTLADCGVDRADRHLPAVLAPADRRCGAGGPHLRLGHHRLGFHGPAAKPARRARSGAART